VAAVSSFDITRDGRGRFQAKLRQKLGQRLRRDAPGVGQEYQ